MSYFAGKQAVITGAGSGIGRALAERLNAAGCGLWLSDIDEQGLTDTLERLSDSDAGIHHALIDVADRSAVERWANEVAAGTGAVDLLVNNAGVALIGDARDTAFDDFHWLMNINFWGVVHGCRAFLPLLERAPRSHLVNISSVFGMIGVPTQSAYNAAKFAVRGYSEALRQELALADSPVQLTCVQPGGIDTDIARRARNTDRAATRASQQAAFEPHVRTTAAEAAAQILRAAERGRPRLLIGRDARIIDWIVRLMPESYPRLFRRQLAALDSDSA
jgi:NAD(P)-dependent dehydrogenase (short-subunit alcohol dehydrogenase family)